jgi:hypothetical protein
MKNRHKEAAIERVRAVTDELEKALDLGWLTIKHIYDGGLDDNDQRNMATTQTDWEYRQASIRWHLPHIATMEDRDLWALAAHEYTHTLLAPLETPISDDTPEAKLAEFVTENLSRSLLSALYWQGTLP